jgi:hypothetical protein
LSGLNNLILSIIMENDMVDPSTATLILAGTQVLTSSYTADKASRDAKKARQQVDSENNKVRAENQNQAKILEQKQAKMNENSLAQKKAQLRVVNDLDEEDDSEDYFSVSTPFVNKNYV